MYGMTKEEATAEADRLNGIVGSAQKVTVERFNDAWGIKFPQEPFEFMGVMIDGYVWGCPFTITKNDAPGVSFTLEPQLELEADPFEGTSIRFISQEAE